MSEIEDDIYDNFVVSRRGEDEQEDEVITAGGTRTTAAERHEMLRRRVANPDDPVIERPPMGKNGPEAGPNYLGAPGRVAIVQGQVYIVAVILIIQLFLITTGLYEFLSGRTQPLWPLTVLSGIGFAIALLVALWPRRRSKGY